MEKRDEAYDRLWLEINEDEKKGLKRTFHGILDEFTGSRMHVSKEHPDSVLKKIRPLQATITDAIKIDYIAGHMLTMEYEEKVGVGFREQRSYSIPGLVTNVFREYARQNSYDFIIFDLGCTLTAIVKSVLLGSDYIVSPFKCERACLTAAEIVMKKLRDWHKRKEDKGNADNPECVLFVQEKVDRSNPDEISNVLKCHPVFLGAFPIAVKVVSGSPTKTYGVRMNEIFDRYNKDLATIYTLPTYKELKNKLTNGNRLAALRECFIENSESAGREAEGGGSLISVANIPCISLCRDYLRNNKLKGRSVTSFLKKADAIYQQYQKVLRVLVSNMEERDQQYVISKSRSLFKKNPIQLSDAQKDDSPAKRRKVPSFASSSSSLFSQGAQEIEENLPGREVEIRKDGNCFFHAVVSEWNRQHLGNAHTAISLRALAVNYLREHHVMFDLAAGGLPEQDNNSAEAYLNRMSKDREYAEGPIIQALAMALNISFTIHHPTSAAQVPQQMNNEADGLVGNVNLIFREIDGEGHYTVLIPAVLELDEDVAAIPEMN